MHPHEQLITRFYRAFQARDAQEMAACYHPAVIFSDPIFVRLEGQSAAALWAMLCARATDLHVTFSAVVADESSGTARWEARYTFAQTQRRVHNQVRASFRFQDGLIVEHRDQFDFRRWSAQALGPLGLLLGWTPFLQQQVRQQSDQALQSYMAQQGRQ
jgi:ketosteroid isomerase-like protein